MTDWAALAEPFPDDEIKQRPGSATWEHRDSCQKQHCRDAKDPAKHLQFSYVDARAVAQRLDDVLTPEGWDFTWTSEGDGVVHGRLIIGTNIREDAGYPNSDRDEEPIKAAVSDALKRCAVLFGVGRHLYEDNKTPTAVRRAAAAVPARQAAPPPRPRVVETEIIAEDEEENPFDDPTSTAPIVRPEPVTCPYHGFELKDRGYGLSCSGKVDKGGPMNKRGYCDWRPAA